MKRQRFKGVCTGVLLFGLLLLTFWLRIQGVERFPTGQFPENDAYLFHRQAETIAAHGYLPARDMDRWLPLGRDNQQLLSVYAYAIAYTQKVFPWWSLYEIQLYLPALCFTLGLGVLFLFLVRFHGYLFAAIVGLLLATLPGSIERSAAGFSDRDAWCWMLGVFAVTCYLYKEQMAPGRRRWLATTLSGVIVFLGGMSWEGFGFFVLMIVAMELYKFCSTDTEQHLKEYHLYILMFVPWFYLISPAYRSGYGNATHVAALMLLPPLTVCALRGIRYLLLHFYPPLRTHSKKLARGLTLLVCIAGGIYFFTQVDTFETSAFAFQESRLMKSIGELVDPGFRYWTARYGAVFVLGSIGLLIGTLQLWKWEGTPLAISLSLFVGTTFFRTAVNSLIGTNLCNTLFFTALVMALIAVGIATLRHETSINQQIMLTMLTWFLLWVALARGGKRFDFFIGLPIAYGTTWLLCFLPPLLIQKLKDAKILYPHINAQRIAASFAFVVLLLVGFWNPLGGHATRAVPAAANMQKPSPGKDESLIQTLTWMKDTLSENAVVAANWGYGMLLNVFAEVKTITDSDHFIPHWVHLYYRNVFCAQSEKEALEFLKSHGATHLMLTKRGVITESKKISYIGSNENNDLYFRVYELESTEKRIGAPYQIRPKRAGTPFEFIDLVSTTPIRSPGFHSHTRPGTQAKIGVTAHLKTHRNIFQEISVNMDKPTLKAVDTENGGIVLYFDSQANFEWAYYIPPLGWNTLAAKLLLRGEHSDAFVPVYPENSEVLPEIKIWEIHYPPDIQTNPKYLKTGFPEIDKTLGLQ